MSFTTEVFMPLQVVIPDGDPIIPELERRALLRGCTADGKPPRNPSEKKKFRLRLPKLARSLITERLQELNRNGDPMISSLPQEAESRG
jgi:hypothetical protein